jgi:hypothetical protein
MGGLDLSDVSLTVRFEVSTMSRPNWADSDVDDKNSFRVYDPQLFENK